jgi:hypothetical protein
LSDGLPMFQRYERVQIQTDNPARAQLNGKVGTILLHPSWHRGEWYYRVEMDEGGHDQDFTERELRRTGEFHRLYHLAREFPAKFHHLQRVRVSLPNHKHPMWEGKHGIVTANAQDLEGKWFFTVFFPLDRGSAIFSDMELEATGGFAKEEEL